MSETIAAGGLEFFLENRTQGQDGGPSLQVRGTVDGATVQLLRFDMFRVKPHYHYAPSGQNLRYDLDPLTLDDGIGWTIWQLRSKLPRLLDKAGFGKLVDEGKLAEATAALPEIERCWRALR